MPYTFQNLVIDFFLTLVSYLLPACFVVLGMQKSHSKKWVFGVTLACILPSYLLWVVLHFASNAIQNPSPAFIWGCVAFAILSARNRALEKNELFASYWAELKDNIEKRESTEEQEEYIQYFIDVKCKGKPASFESKLSSFIRKMTEQMPKQHKKARQEQEAPVVPCADEREPAPEPLDKSRSVENSIPATNIPISPNPENGAQAPERLAATKKLFCKHCGASCENGASYCPNCGKRVRLFSRQQNKSPITGIFLCISIVVNILLLSALVPALITNDELEQRYETMSQTITSLHGDIDSLKSSLKSKQTELNGIKSGIAFIVDTYGDVYHTYDCHFIRDSNHYWACGVRQAVNMGYRPCEVCH